MTDKQTTDRVNVKECKYYCNGKCERYEEFVEADYADYSVKCICEKENDLFTYDICDYQQLKRKEQECERLSKGYAELTDIVSPYMDDFTGYNEELGGFDLILCVKELMDELDQLKAESEQLKSDYFTVIQQRNVAEQQLDKLKAENEKLREIMHKDYCTHYVLGECSQEHHNNCVGRNQCIKDLEQQLDQLKQTLTEIKEIAEPYNDMSGNCVIVNCFEDMYKILQKISECEVK